MNTEYRKLKNLFLRQSCQDAWEDYARSIRKVNFPRWDYVILTSSNEEQARSFRSQIADRLEQGVLPGWTKYFVLPDPEGKRVGSGGATLNVLRFLSEEEGLRGDFHNKRILVIHSGGDSKRVPQYSVCGKLFSPVPRELPDGRGSTLFDEFLISMAGVPARFKEGMLVLSGDVLLLFNPLQIDAQFRGAAAISMKSPVEVGVDHGVFLNDGSDHVKMFLHKQPAETLRRLGAVNGQDCVDLDTGAVLLDAEILETLFSLIADASGKKADPDKYESFVNEKARVSFYGDFLYPLAADSTFEQYQKEKPEGEFCTELFTCREKIWKALSPFQMKLICLSPAEFIHFGTTRELRALMTEEVTDYEFLDWKKHVFTNDLNCQGALHTALIGPEADIEEGTYIEDTCLEGRTYVGKGAVVSGLSLKDVHIPANTVFHGVKLKDEITELCGGQTGRCVIRTYGVMDNPKKTLEERGSFLRGNLADFLSANGLEPEDIWTGETHALWNAKLYPVCKTFQEAAQAGNLLVKMSEGLAEPRQIESWKKQPRLSLEESFRYGNTENILSWKKDLEARILVAVFLGELKKGGHYIPALKIFGEKEIQERHYHLLMKEAEKADFSQKIRILYAVSRSMKFTKKCFDGKTYDVLEQECFSQIQKEIASQTQLTGNCGYTIAKEQVKVNLPVRVNWGGGWSDTPPYCNEHGGTVLNAAILLRGCEPIEVEIRKIPELHIELASTDTGAYGTAESAEEIQDCHNPYDPFALHKAAIIACGILPLEEKADLKKVLEKMGGGFYLSTCVKGVPKGSGLGTSSILAGACVKAFATMVYTVLDKSMIGWITGSEFQNGYYEQAYKIEQILLVFVTTVGTVTFPRMAYFFENDNKEERKRIMGITMKFIMLIACPICFGTMAISENLIPVFLGKGYEECILLLRIFSFLIIIIGLDNTIGKQCLISAGKQKEYNIGVIGGAIVNFVTNILLISKLGACGAAIASVFAESVILVVFIIYSKVELKIPKLSMCFFKYFISAICMSIMVWRIGILISNKLVALSVQIFVGIILYGLFLLLMKDEFVMESIRRVKLKI